MTALRNDRSQAVLADAPRRIPPVDPTSLATVAATLYVEVRAGRRAPRQLDQMVSARVQRRLWSLVTRTRGDRGLRGVVTCRRVMSQEVAPGIVESTVIVAESNKVGAVCVRLELLDHRWVITELAAPQDFPTTLGTPRFHL